MDCLAPDLMIYDVERHKFISKNLIKIIWTSQDSNLEPPPREGGVMPLDHWSTKPS